MSKKNELEDRQCGLPHDPPEKGANSESGGSAVVKAPMLSTTDEVCRIEKDGLVSDVFDWLGVSQAKVTSNMEIQYYCEDEKQRKRNKGVDTELLPRCAQNRIDVEPTVTYALDKVLQAKKFSGSCHCLVPQLDGDFDEDSDDCGVLYRLRKRTVRNDTQSRQTKTQSCTTDIQSKTANQPQCKNVDHMECARLTIVSEEFPVTKRTNKLNFTGRGPGRSMPISNDDSGVRYNLRKRSVRNNTQSLSPIKRSRATDIQSQTANQAQRKKNVDATKDSVRNDEVGLKSVSQQFPVPNWRSEGRASPKLTSTRRGPARNMPISNDDVIQYTNCNKEDIINKPGRGPARSMPISNDDSGVRYNLRKRSVRNNTQSLSPKKRSRATDIQSQTANQAQRKKNVDSTKDSVRNDEGGLKSVSQQFPIPNWKSEGRASPKLTSARRGPAISNDDVMLYTNCDKEDITNKPGREPARSMKISNDDVILYTNCDKEDIINKPGRGPARSMPISNDDVILYTNCDKEAITNKPGRGPATSMPISNDDVILYTNCDKEDIINKPGRGPARSMPISNDDVILYTNCDNEDIINKPGRGPARSMPISNDDVILYNNCDKESITNKPGRGPATSMPISNDDVILYTNCDKEDIINKPGRGPARSMPISNDDVILYTNCDNEDIINKPGRGPARSMPISNDDVILYNNCDKESITNKPGRGPATSMPISNDDVILYTNCDKEDIINKPGRGPARSMPISNDDVILYTNCDNEDIINKPGRGPARSMPISNDDVILYTNCDKEDIINKPGRGPARSMPISNDVILYTNCDKEDIINKPGRGPARSMPILNDDVILYTNCDKEDIINKPGRRPARSMPISNNDVILYTNCNKEDIINKSGRGPARSMPILNDDVILNTNCDKEDIIKKPEDALKTKGVKSERTKEFSNPRKQNELNVQVNEDPNTKIRDLLKTNPNSNTTLTVSESKQFTPSIPLVSLLTEATSNDTLNVSKDKPSGCKGKPNSSKEKLVVANTENTDTLLDDKETSFMVRVNTNVKDLFTEVTMAEETSIRTIRSRGSGQVDYKKVCTVNIFQKVGSDNYVNTLGSNFLVITNKKHKKSEEHPCRPKKPKRCNTKDQVPPAPKNKKPRKKKIKFECLNQAYTDKVTMQCIDHVIKQGGTPKFKCVPKTSYKSHKDKIRVTLLQNILVRPPNENSTITSENYLKEDAGSSANIEDCGFTRTFGENVYVSNLLEQHESLSTSEILQPINSLLNIKKLPSKKRDTTKEIWKTPRINNNYQNLANECPSVQKLILKRQNYQEWSVEIAPSPKKLSLPTELLKNVSPVITESPVQLPLAPIPDTSNVPSTQVTPRTNYYPLYHYFDEILDYEDDECLQNLVRTPLYNKDIQDLLGVQEVEGQVERTKPDDVTNSKMKRNQNEKFAQSERQSTRSPLKSQHLRTGCNAVPSQR